MSTPALADPDSIFHYYRQLIRLRKENPVIVYGRYDLLLEAHERDLRLHPNLWTTTACW